jgi:hypothetical protein
LRSWGDFRRELSKWESLLRVCEPEEKSESMRSDCEAPDGIVECLEILRRVAGDADVVWEESACHPQRNETSFGG